jgi:hypothetical protein
MNQNQVTQQITPHSFTWAQFLQWIEGEPRPDTDTYYPKDVDRFIFWMTKKRNNAKP